MTTTTIRPGILVVIRNNVNGGVEYRRDEIAADEAAAVAGQDADEKTKVEAWKTIKVTTDADEHARALNIRTLAVRGVAKHCMVTSFGHIAPQANEKELDAAYAESRAMVDEFNRTAKYTTIAFGLLKGRIAANDEEAVRAITGEIATLVATMNRSIDRLDVDAIRKAATQAQNMAAILGEDEQEKVSAAVEAARKAARMITKRIAKDGEPAATVLRDIQRGALESARIAFLDLDEQAPPSGDEMPVADMGRASELDLAPEVLTPESTAVVDVAPEVMTPAPAPVALDLTEAMMVTESTGPVAPSIEFE